jgi:hypothetical protein
MPNEILNSSVVCYTCSDNGVKSRIINSNNFKLTACPKCKYGQLVTERGLLPSSSNLSFMSKEAILKKLKEELKDV